MKHEGREVYFGSGVRQAWLRGTRLCGSKNSHLGLLSFSQVCRAGHKMGKESQGRSHFLQLGSASRIFLNFAALAGDQVFKHMDLLGGFCIQILSAS